MNLGLWGAISPKTILGAIKRSSADTTAPTAPTGLSAAPVSASQIDLSWIDASSDEAGFRVYRSTDGVNYSQLGTDLAAGTQAYSDTTPTAGTKYYYKVGVFDAAGNEAQTSAVTANTLTFNLTAYWKLDETSGNRADSVGSNTLTDINTVTSNPGKQGNAGQFTAANHERLKIVDNPSISNTGDLTIACWVYADTLSGTMGIVCKEPNNFSVGEYEIYYNGSRFVFILLNTSNTAFTATANNLGAPSTSTWYFIVATFTASSGAMTIQVNDGTANTATLTGTARDGTQNLVIGAQVENNTREWDGRIDEIGIWKRVLSAAERTALYNGGSGATYPF